MSKFAERLKELRNQRGLSQYKLADLLDVSPSTVAAWEVGRNEPNYDMLKKIADFFEVSVDYLLGKTDDPTPSHKRIEDYPWYVELRPIPVYNGAKAGLEGKFPDDSEIVTWISIPKKSPGKFAVIVHGDSMEPEISDGDMVVVDPDVEIQPNDRVVVIFEDDSENEGAVVKIFQKQGNIVILTSKNPEYPPIVVTRKTRVLFVGKVVGLWRAL